MIVVRRHFPDRHRQHPEAGRFQRSHLRARDRRQIRAKRDRSPGVVSIPHGRWRSLTGGAANDLTSDGLADRGGGGDFYGTRVEVERLLTT